MDKEIRQLIKERNKILDSLTNWTPKSKKRIKEIDARLDEIELFEYEKRFPNFDEDKIRIEKLLKES